MRDTVQIIEMMCDGQKRALGSAVISYFSKPNLPKLNLQKPCYIRDKNPIRVRGHEGVNITLIKKYCITEH